MKLNQHDLDRALKILPETLKALLISNGKSLVVAGGFLRSVVLHEHIKDIDLFSPSKEMANHWAIQLNKMSESGIITTQNAYSIKDVGGYFVQFIHRWTYPTPEELIESFDFTISKAAMWFDFGKGIWDSVVDENFYPDCAAKRIVYTNPDRQEEPAGSMLRVLKFVKNGYHIPSDSLAGVIAKLVNGSIKNDTGDYLPIEDDPSRTHSIIYRSIQRVTGES